MLYEVITEIVVPVMKNGKFIAELDIDSHSPAPFIRITSYNVCYTKLLRIIHHVRPCAGRIL